MATNMLPYQLSNQQMNRSPLSGLVNSQSTVPTMFGRIVNDEKEIRPNEVPMNGYVSFFPKADYSEVYARSWNVNGTIDAVTYVPVNQNDQIETLLANMNKRLDSIEAILNRKQHNNNQQRQKKAGDTND